MIQVDSGTITLSAIFLMLLSAFLGYAFGIRRIKFQAKHNAAIELKKAFNPIIEKINHGESPTIMVAASFHKQQEVANEYAAYLEGNKLIKYNAAFNTYSTWFKLMCNQSAATIMYGDDSPEYILAKSQDPVELMKAILKYANT